MPDRVIATIDLPAQAQAQPGLDPLRQEPLRSHPLDLPRSIARQVAEAVKTNSGGPLELTLAPEELGRVRMTLHPMGDGITVSFVAERGETLDLMRRHSDTLAQEFRALGYASVGFEFGQGRQSQPDQPPVPRPAAAPRPDQPPPLPPEPEAPARRPRAEAGTGLDLRL